MYLVQWFFGVDFIGYFPYYLSSFQYSNSAMNPVLYAFLSENFKKSFRKACHCDQRDQAVFNHHDYSANTRWAEHIKVLPSRGGRLLQTCILIGQEAQLCLVQSDSSWAVITNLHFDWARGTTQQLLSNQNALFAPCLAMLQKVFATVEKSLQVIQLCYSFLASPLWQFVLRQ